MPTKPRGNHETKPKRTREPEKFVNHEVDVELVKNALSVWESVNDRINNMDNDDMEKLLDWGSKNHWLTGDAAKSLESLLDLGDGLAGNIKKDGATKELVEQLLDLGNGINAKIALCLDKTAEKVSKPEDKTVPKKITTTPDNKEKKNTNKEMLSYFLDRKTGVLGFNGISVNIVVPKTEFLFKTLPDNKSKVVRGFKIGWMKLKKDVANGKDMPDGDVFQTVQVVMDGDGRLHVHTQGDVENGNYLGFNTRHVKPDDLGAQSEKEQLAAVMNGVVEKVKRQVEEKGSRVVKKSKLKPVAESVVTKEVETEAKSVESTDSTTVEVVEAKPVLEQPAEKPDGGVENLPIASSTETVENDKEITRNDLFGAVEFGLELVKQKIRSVERGGGKNKDADLARLTWIADAVTHALVDTKENPYGKIKVESGDNSQYEGVPVDELIDALETMNAQPGASKEKIKKTIKLLKDNSQSYFDAHPSMRGEEGKSWDQQHWRTQLEAYYISQDRQKNNLPGDADSDYRQAMEVMSRRRELILPPPKSTVEQPVYHPLAEVKNLAEVPSSNTIEAVVAKHENDKNWWEGMSDEDLEQWRAYNELTVKLLEREIGRDPRRSLSELDAPTEEEQDRRFKKLTRELSAEGFVVHGKVEPDKKEKNKLVLNSYSDLDGKSALALFRLAGFDTRNTRYVQPGDTAVEGIHLDTGNKNGLVIEEKRESAPKGERGMLKKLLAIFDHHGSGAAEETSTTKLVYDYLTTMGFLDKKEHPNLERFVDFINRKDAGEYLNNATQYFADSYKNLVGLADHVHISKMDRLIEMFENGVNDTYEPTDQELRELGLIHTNKDGRLLNRKEILKKAVEDTPSTYAEMVREGFLVESDRYGKILVNVNGEHDGKKYPNLSTGYFGARASGADAWVIWSPQRNSFIFSSSTPLSETDAKWSPDVIAVHDHMLIKPLRVEKTAPLSMTLQDLLMRLTDGKLKAGGNLAKSLEQDEARLGR